ncbi:MAG TPA: MFS transporter, partial [bacterium]|nr:MFS transporter [bacterium]
MTIAGLAPGRTFIALRHPHFRRFWWGGLISMTGSWMRITAQAWLVYDLTGSPFMLGAVMLANTIPTMLLGVFGGVIADRSEKRHLLIGTQAVFMMVAITLALLTLTGRITVWYILSLSMISGIAAALDMPARQSLIAHLVDRDDLFNAIALNSAAFNGSRIIGPAIAGLIIDQLGNRNGPGWSFAVNSVSYLAVIGALATIAVNSRPASGERQPLLGDLREGVAFAWRHPLLRSLLGLLALAGVFGLSFHVLMPVFARDVLHVPARGYGMLLTAGGLGATIGVLTLATIRPARLGTVILVTSSLFVVLLAAFAASASFPLSLVLLLCLSGAMTAYMSATNTLIQTSVPDALRGRVMSLYMLAFFGTAPLGGLLMGALASALGSQTAVFIGAAVCGLGVLAVWSSGGELTRHTVPSAASQGYESAAGQP